MKIHGSRVPVFRAKGPDKAFMLARTDAVLASGTFSNRGPQHIELENRIGDWLSVDAECVVLTANATLAIQAVVELSPVSKWNVPSWTFPAPALAVLNAGRELRFVDVCRDTWLPARTNYSESDGTISVIPFGTSFDSNALQLRGEHIIDAAASLAARPTGLEFLPEKSSVVFSLHATKLLGGGEGGVVICSSPERAAAIRRWANFGFTPGRQVAQIGTNAKLSEFDAAAVNAKFDTWQHDKKIVEERRGWVEKSSRQLGIGGHPAVNYGVGPYWIGLFESKEERKFVANRLYEHQIETKLWWGSGLNRMQLFSSVPRTDLSVADDIASRYLGLPFFQEISRAQVEKVHRAVSVSLQEYRSRVKG